MYLFVDGMLKVIGETVKTRQALGLPRFGHSEK